MFRGLQRTTRWFSQAPNPKIARKSAPPAPSSPSSSSNNLFVVKNVASTARDHLANERTFLAWGRTGLGFITAGTGLFTAYSFGYSPDKEKEAAVHPTEVIPSSLLLVGNGALVLGYSLMRYTSVQSALRAGEFIIAKKGVLGVILATGVNTTVAIGLLFQTEIRAKQMLADLDRSLAGNSMSVLPLPQYTAEAHKMDVDVDAKESSPQRGSTH